MNEARAEPVDIFVIGGGPAGSTASTLLREAGHRVVLAEKDAHPRFHIGESLLPMNLPIFERLGIADRVRGIGVHKLGADFTPDSAGPEHLTFRFNRALGDSPPHAYEVRRSEFDRLLFEHAAQAGVETHEHCEVTDVRAAEDGDHVVTTRGAEGRTRKWRARYLVDASGRDTFLARCHGWKERSRRHASAAIFGHFTGVTRRPGDDAGNISIYWIPHGWIWMIPLPDGVMSVGAVCWPDYLKRRRGRDPGGFLADTLALCPAAAGRMAGSSVVQPARVTGNYSYRSRRLIGPGYVLLGDAYAFVDPVFSSGVYLAMNSAERATVPIGHWLAGDRRAFRRSAKAYERTIRKGLDAFSWFIHRFTSPAMRSLFRNPRNNWQVEQAVISLLAGDVFANRPVERRLAIFRLLYGCAMLSHWKASLRAWQRRRMNVRDEFA